ncbi:MAG: hypothetical protein GY869_03410, partial [Planctomycetes bacterium]|nr:hypothetical protein [Planctomycetota bacterium]
YRVNPATGTVTVVAEGFQDLLHCCLEIDPTGRRLYVADNGYNRVYEFALTGGYRLDVSVFLEGAARPDPDGYQIPLIVNFFAPGDDVLNDMPLYHSHIYTQKVAAVAVGSIPGFAPGIYDITASSDHTLMNLEKNVNLIKKCKTI